MSYYYYYILIVIYSARVTNALFAQFVFYDLFLFYVPTFVFIVLLLAF